MDGARVARSAKASPLRSVLGNSNCPTTSSTISSLTENHATGKPYCLAHQLTVDGDHRRLMIATLRYLDTFAKVDGAWLLAERRLYVDWIEERTLS